MTISRPTRAAAATLTALAVATALSSVVACTPEKETRSQAPGAAVKTVADRDSAWDKSTIDVCWEIATPSTEAFRTAMKEAIVAGFKGSVFTFRGFEECGKVGGDIRIFIYDDVDAKGTDKYRHLLGVLNTDAKDGGEFKTGVDGKRIGLGHPRVRRIGKEIAGLEAGLVLNKTFEDAMPGTDRVVATTLPENHVNFWVSVSLHEFGHALGLRHESAHSGNLCDDKPEDPGEKGFDVSPYNPFSFMNRCYYRTFNYDLGKVVPNARDIEGINTFHAHLKAKAD